MAEGPDERPKAASPEGEDDGAEGGPREEGRLGEVREGRERMRGECADRARKADDARVDPEERPRLRLVLRLDHDGHEDVEGGDAHADEKRAEKERGIARRRAHESAGGKHAEKDDDGAVESEAAAASGAANEKSPKAATGRAAARPYSEAERPSSEVRRPASGPTAVIGPRISSVAARIRASTAMGLR